MKVSIPPPPVASSTKRVETSAPSSTKPLPPIDAAFLKRTYRSMLWFGIAITVLAAFGWGQNFAATGSFIGGLILAATLLRVQEVSLRSILRPKEQLAGFDARLLVVMLLPLKFLAIGGVLWAADASGFLRPGPLALGFFAAQLVLVAKIAGWMMARRAA